MCWACASRAWYSGSLKSASATILVWVSTSPSPCHSGSWGTAAMSASQLKRAVRVSQSGVWLGVK